MVQNEKEVTVIDFAVAQAARTARELLGGRKPCLRVLDDGGEVADVGQGQLLCDNPATFMARGNRAKYGHLCFECWQALDTEDERNLYAHENELGCDHKFVDSNRCLKCVVHVDVLRYGVQV